MKNNTDQINIDIIGRGNVATHLQKALEGKVSVRIVNPRTLENLREGADIVLICVADRAIPSVFSKIKGHSGIIAHTSGSTSIDALSRPQGKFGVFYPLQTFSKDITLEYENIPFFIEGENRATVESLSSLAGLISRNVKEADTSYRRRLHLASVFACNFTNHLWTLAERYLEDGGGEFADIRPLIEETVRKSSFASPFECQTGPASRGDFPIMELQSQALSSYPGMKELYEKLSRSIMDHHKVGHSTSE